ncbi:M1 family metallopeptidase [Candidatus Saccharibacteria bacterium]|nr:M1 family metallopeptidase [Candidatus Saccharibacteria bacterium]
MERLLEYFVPEKYQLNLKIDKNAKTIGGSVRVDGEALADKIKFHAVNLEIDAVRVDGVNAKFEHEGDVLTVFDVMDGGRVVEIEYHGNLNENMQGAYLSTYEYDGKTETIVATQFESHYAREAFPCIDEPEAKAAFELTIETGADDLVLANTKKIKAENGTFVFEPTPKMSTYLLAFVIGKFHGKTIRNTHGVEITTYAALNQDIETVDFANEVAARSLEFYDDNFGVKYPLDKLEQVALPDFEAGAMENWGLVTYRESMLLAGKNATLDTKKSVALTVAHELSHQWYGDHVTMKWWDDLWLNESFASIMEYYAVDNAYTEFKIFENFFCGDALAALKRDCYEGVQSVHQDVENPEEIATLFDPAIVYAKGARLMLMIIRLMGWNEFCRGLKDYFEKFQYGNTVGDDLWAALMPYATFNVGEMMHAFIDKPGYPVITGDDDFVKFSQKRFLLDGEMRDESWPLREIREDMSGHYVLNLTDAEFAERLERFDELGLEEKLRLLIDRDLLAKTDLVQSASLIPLVQKFEKESSAAVWGILASIVSGLKIFFEHGSEEERKFKRFIKQLLAEKIAEVGLWTEKDEDDTIIRLRLILLALDFYASTDDVTMQENMRKLAAGYDKDLAKIPAEIRSCVLDAKLFLEPTKINEYVELYKKTADPEIKFDLLFAMTLVQDDEALSQVKSLLEQPEIVKPQDQFHLFIYLYRNPAVKAEVFEWLTHNWEYVKNLAGDKSLDNYPRYTATSVRNGAEYRAWCDFFEPMKDNLALNRAIEVGKREIEARLKLIAADQTAVWNAL